MDTVKGAYINKRGNVVFCPIGAESTFPDFASRVYASAPPSPASVQNASLVEKLAKRTCEANADSARFTIALQTLRASLDPDDWMGAVTMHNYIDAVLAGGSPLQQHPAPSPAQAVDAVGEPWVVFDSQGYYAWHSTEVSAKEWCEHYNARSADDPLKPYVCRRISECAALQASRQPQAQQGVAAPLELKVCHSQNASQTPQADLSLVAAPQGLPPHFPHEADRETGEGLEPAYSVSKLHEYAEHYAHKALRAQAARQPQAQQAVAEGAGDGLRQTLIDVGRVIAWQCFGDCRAYDEFGPGSLRGLHEMDAEIRAALATKEPK